jgi:hypothetical protein
MRGKHAEAIELLKSKGAIDLECGGHAAALQPESGGAATALQTQSRCLVVMIPVAMPMQTT